MSDVLGGFEHRVLLVMMRLGAETYSVPIVRKLEALDGRPVAPAAVYVTLRRLEKRGLLTSSMVPPEEGAGGRPRRVFTVKDEAVALLRSLRADLEGLWDGVEALEI